MTQTVYTSGEAQIVNDQQGSQNAEAQGQDQNQGGEQKPLVNQPENQDSQQPDGQNSQEKSQEIQELEQRLGYSVDQLGEQPQPQQQPQQEQSDQQQQQEPEIDPKLEAQFEKWFENKFGVKPDQVQQQFQDLQQFKQQQLVQQQTQALQQEWGDAFDERISKVKEYFNNRLTPEQQQALDNADGARLIWARIQQEEGQNQPNPPNFAQQQSQSPEQRVSQPSTSYMFTKSQLDKMSLKEYNENVKNIEYAITNGLVNYNA